ncbi:MAG: exo-beta-N-acetylmuramidase NamZ domain-containing protein [Bacteroidia bacterium]
MSFRKNTYLTTLIIAIFSFLCEAQTLSVLPYSSVITGAERFEQYLPDLKNKKVAVLTNQTGIVGNKSIVDTLLSLGVDIVKVFGPEHGFRGNSDAGIHVSDQIDLATKLPVISLYGKHKKPTAEDLKSVDVLIYDIQDVGVRFYTYISTMCLAMEACAENSISVIILDRPNPNGFYIDGPVMQNDLKSFLGMHNIPLVYGMTAGEYATMANQEKWLSDSLKCNLKIIACLNYDRNSSYELPMLPSPNLRSAKSILLYPSLGLFEGTEMSI